MSELLILDLGYGNTRSVALAFERLGAAPTLSSDAAAVEQSARVVVPGVGAAAAAMARLTASGIADVLRRRAKPTLGVCLGMQLMFEQSEEDGGTALLGVLPGTVAAIRPVPGFPVPHMGWTRVAAAASGLGLTNGDHLYFAHGFACPDSSATVARAIYGDATIPAVVRHGAWWGAQFHPERSSGAGSRFLKAFLNS